MVNSVKCFASKAFCPPFYLTSMLMTSLTVYELL